MKLAEWLKSTRTRRYEFARRIGVAPSMVGDYCKGVSWPGRDKMEAIRSATDGLVTANDFMRETAE